MKKFTPNEIIAIIPARGASKRIPRKNLIRITGRPLIAQTIIQAKHSRSIHTVYVSTEDDEIAEICRHYEAEVVRRPIELAGDEATSESGLLHVLDKRAEDGLSDPDLVVFLQCTSPLREEGDIDNAIKTLRESNADSLFSACRFNKYIWEFKDGKISPLNYNYKNRWREQDFPLQFQENGSIYIFKPWVLRELNNRLGGKIAIYEMSYLQSFQIDSLEDFELCEYIIENQLSKRQKENAK